MQFATAAVPVPIDSEQYYTEFEEEIVAESEAVGWSIHVDLNSDSDCRSDCLQIPGGLPVWLDAIAEGEGEAAAAAVDWNSQANETTYYFRQIVHHNSFLLPLPLPAE